MITLDDGVPWLNRVQIMSGGAELENIDEYSRLHCLMQQIQGNPAQAGEWALTNNQNFPLTSAPAAVTPIASAAVLANDGNILTESTATDITQSIANAHTIQTDKINAVLANLGSDSVYKHAPAADKNRTLSGGGKEAANDAGYSSSFTYNINLISAILNTPKYFPLIFTNLGIDVLLYLEAPANVGVWGAGDGAGTGADAASTAGYKISDCKWHCHMVDVDRTFYDQLRQSMMSTGGMLQFSGTTYRHYLESHDQNSTTHNLTIPTRVKSLNALYIRPQRQELNNNNRVFSLSVGEGCRMSEYLFRIGSMEEFMILHHTGYDYTLTWDGMEKDMEDIVKYRASTVADGPDDGGEYDYCLFKDSTMLLGVNAFEELQMYTGGGQTDTCVAFGESQSAHGGLGRISGTTFLSKLLQAMGCAPARGHEQSASGP